MRERIESSHLFVPVDPRLVGNRCSFLIHRDDLLLTPIDKASQLDREDKCKAQQYALPIGDRLRKGLQMAAEEIHLLRAQLGLPKKDNLEVLFLDSWAFTKFFPESCIGWHVTTTGLSVVRNDGNFPDYLLASFALHEWIHGEFERKISVYSTEPNTLDNGTDYPERFTYSMRRAGLERRRFSVLTGKTIREGELLNELGNYALQAEFLKKVLREENIFAEELDVRRNALRQYHENPDTIRSMCVALRCQDTSYSFTADWDTLLVGTEGKLLLGGKYTKLCINLQFADSLSELVTEVDGEPFPIAVLKAKMDPRRIHSLRRAVNSAMGYDFFAKLIDSADYRIPQILPLLIEVQNTL